MEIRSNVILKDYTSFKTGGPADEFCEAKSAEEIMDLINYAKNKGMEYTIIGNGTNLLVSDNGVRGLVIRICGGFDEITVCNGKITAKSGVILSRLAKAAYDFGLSGLEFASGIPGTLGGAIYMNAGAYGGEMKDVVRSVEYLDNNEVKTVSSEELDFGYRHSFFSGKDCVILSAELEFTPAPKEEIKAKMDDFRKRRTEKQPLSMPSAGSTFKRPEGYFAGKLIEDAGLRGFRIGGAKVSEKHCGFVVNCGGAASADIAELICFIRKTVKEKFGVELDTEVKFLGDF